ncbi:MAG: phenylalanine--tRNA ligase subunit beta [Cytophagales bacterium]|jgi:phenylalanyl-tRNA synthetase beta chain|nr:phenylalanine--tRNA ligase subunit beta [Cytophagales bacterium]
MKISLAWLSDFVDLKDIDCEQICKILTACGLEAEGVEIFNPVNNCGEFLIGEIVEAWQHHNADKLKCTRVDIGQEEFFNIVCGAPNVRKGIKVVVAPVNATLITFTGEKIKIKKSKIRGEISEGMLCAEDEVGLSNVHETIIELDTDLPNGSSLKKIFKDQEIVEIDITPNRADACSHLGVARDLRAVKNLSLHYPDLYNFKNIVVNPKPLTLCDECSRLSTVVVKNLKITNSPDWIQDRLNAVGVRSINNVVDATNYVMMELGQPLHAYDLSCIADENIFIRRARMGEKFRALNKEDYELTGNELVVADKEKVLSLAGVMGGLNSGVKNNSTSILFESACFDPSIVRKTSKKLNLKSEASYRFERGTDPFITLTALQRVCFLLQQQQPDILIENITDSFTKEPEYRKIYFNYERAKKLIGTEIPNETITEILTRLDVKLENISPEGFTALVPPYRVDVCREADLVEEILRIYGYDNVSCEENFKITILNDQFSEVANANFIKNKISNVLAARGFQEIFSNSLASSDDVDEDKVILANSVSSKLNSLRTSMLPNILEVVDYNFNHDQKVIKIFEIGKTYHREVNKNIHEVEHCACAIANKKQKIFSFFDLKNEIYNVLQALNFLALEEKLESNGVSIFVKDEKLCSIKTILHNGYEIFFADIILSEIPKLQMSFYTEISKFPNVVRDLSVVIDKNISYQDIKKIIEDFDSAFITDYKIVDVYEKEFADKKTYTISFTLHSLKYTLSDKIIQTTMSSLIAEFENKIQAKIFE